MLKRIVSSFETLRVGVRRLRKAVGLFNKSGRAKITAALLEIKKQVKQLTRAQVALLVRRQDEAAIQAVLELADDPHALLAFSDQVKYKSTEEEMKQKGQIIKVGETLKRLTPVFSKDSRQCAVPEDLNYLEELVGWNHLRLGFKHALGSLPRWLCNQDACTIVQGKTLKIVELEHVNPNARNVYAQILFHTTDFHQFVSKIDVAEEPLAMTGDEAEEVKEVEDDEEMKTEDEEIRGKSSGADTEDEARSRPDDEGHGKRMSGIDEPQSSPKRQRRNRVVPGVASQTTEVGKPRQPNDRSETPICRQFTPSASLALACCSCLLWYVRFSWQPRRVVFEACPAGGSEDR